MNEKVISTKNTRMLQGIGVAMNVVEEEEAILENGAKLDDMVAAVQKDMEEKGNDDLRVIDLTNLEVLADDSRYTPNVSAIVQVTEGLRDNIKSIQAVDIEVPTSYKELNYLSFKLNQIGFEAVKALLRNWKDVIDHPEKMEDTLVDDLFLEAGLDLLRRQLPITRMYDEKGLEIPEGMSPEQLEEVSKEAYMEWLEEEYNAMIEYIVEDPMRTYILKPMGVSEVKDVLKRYASSADDEYIDSLSPVALFSGEVFEELKKRNIVTQDSMADITSAVSTFMNQNALAMVPMGGNTNQERPLLNSLDLSQLVTHIFILNSAMLWNEDLAKEDLPENTKYLVDLIEVVLQEKLPSGVSMGPLTPYKILSIFSAVTQLMVSQNAILRNNQQLYMAFCSSVVRAVLALQEEDIKGPEEVQN